MKSGGDAGEAVETPIEPALEEVPSEAEPTVETAAEGSPDTVNDTVEVEPAAEVADGSDAKP